MLKRASRPSPLLVMLIALTMSCEAAEEVTFNAGFLNPNLEAIDVSQFNKGNPLYAGSYLSDIYINQNLSGRLMVRLGQVTDQAEPQLCLDMALLNQGHVNTEQLTPALNQRLQDPAECVTPEQISPELSWHYAIAELALHLVIPQSLQLRADRAGVPPEQWSWGEPMVSLGYDLNDYHSDYAGQSYTSRYLGLNGGANLGNWRLRHQSSLQQGDQDEAWSNIATYAQRSLPDWRSRLTLGQSWSSGEFFDAVSYQGINLGSDPRMLPESQRGFAPTVRGIARTHAKVTIEQNGYLLYETTVPPGSFVIDDLYPTGYGGDLQVTIQEADGSRQAFRVPYAAVPGMVRAGTTFYNATFGEVRDDALQGQRPLLGQFTLQQGVSNLLTGYSGLSLLEEYSALLVGSAINTSLGAFSLDLTHANLSERDSSSQGEKYRANFSRQVTTTDTHLSLTASRTSNEEYYGLQEAISRLYGQNQDFTRQWHERQRLDLSINQALGSGSLYLIGSRSWYWQAQPDETSLQLGYSDMLGNLGYQLSAQHSQTSTGQRNWLYGLTLSLPLGSRGLNGSVTMQLTHDPANGSQLQTTLAGAFGEESQYSYGLTASHQAPQQGESVSGLGVNGSYRSSHAYYNGSLSQDSQQQRQYSVGVRGAIVAHAGGWLAVPELGDTFAIIAAPQAAGAKLTGWAGVTINDEGYAIAPNLTPFSRNHLELDPQGTLDTVELSTTSQWVVPDAGAAVPVQFATKVGYGLLLDTRLANQQPAPFGAQVLDAQGQEVGTVGQGGQLYARVSQLRGQLHVRWGGEVHQQCQLNYQLPADAAGLSLIAEPQTCLPLTADHQE